MSHNEMRNLINLVEKVNYEINNKEFLIERNPLATARITASQLVDVLNFLKNGKDELALLNKIGVKNTDDLLKVIKNDFTSLDNASKKIPRLSPNEARKLRGSLELGILKSSNSSKELLDIAAENLVKNSPIISKYKAIGNEADFVNALKKNGYSDQGAKAIARKRTELKNKPPIPDPNKPPVPDPNKPPVPDPNKPPVIIQNWWQIIIVKLKEGLSWKKILAFGLALGIPASLIYYIVTNSGEKLPVDIEKPKEEITGWEKFPCIQKGIKKGDLKVVLSSDVTKVIHTKKPDLGGSSNEYYYDGRVIDTKTGKKGTWKCGTKIKTYP